jgi:hypothetical protein
MHGTALTILTLAMTGTSRDLTARVTIMNQQSTWTNRWGPTNSMVTAQAERIGPKQRMQHFERYFSRK